MSRGYWFALAALGLTFALSLQAQEQEQPAENRPENQAKSSESLPPEVSVQIIEDDEAANARLRREEASREREIEDLIAQQRMADATEAMNDATQSMKWAAWWSVAIVGIGTALLLCTLLITRQANKAAQDAVKITRQMGHAQVRAYLSIGNAYLYVTRGAEITLGIRNSGISPAKWFEIASRVKVIRNGDDAEFTADSENVETIRWNQTIYDREVHIPAGELAPEGYTDFKHLCRELWASAEEGIAVEGFLRWETVFGEVFESEFYFFSAIDPNGPKHAGGPIHMRRPAVSLRTYEKRKSVPGDD